MNGSKDEHQKRPYEKPRYEVADVFRLYFEGYSQRHLVTDRERLIVERIMGCRTGELGGHLQRCNDCGYEEVVPDSCRDRHCTKCQYREKEQWVMGRVSSLLPVSYFHIVFTVPHQLNPLILLNKKVMYDLLFEATSETLHTFGRDENRLGVELGFTGILHTWDLINKFHLHTHYLVTAGGLSLDGKRWVEPKYAHKFLFPVRAMSKVMRGKYLQKLRLAYEAGELKFGGQTADLEKRPYFEMFVSDLSSKLFRIHVEPPFESPVHVVEYFGRYTHRVALTNHRLKSIEGGFITFSYKDRENKGHHKEMTLTADQFIARFLLHILPKGFHKIRHFGLNSSAAQKTKVPLIWKLLHNKEGVPQIVDRLVDKVEAMQTALRNLLTCKVCGLGQMRFVRLIPFAELLEKNPNLLFGNGL